MTSPISAVGLFHNETLPPESNFPYLCMDIEHRKAGLKNSLVDSPLNRGIQAFPVEWPQAL